MYRRASVVAVVPAHNEATQIGRVIETMPDFVDRIVVVDDASHDDTASVVRRHADQEGDRLLLLQHEVNQGVGAAIATGYKWACQQDFDVAVVMAGDGQMDPENLPALLDPIIDGEADYTKGNRLLHGEVFQLMPKVRFFGSAVLSLLTKIASGYWHIADPQNGYTAINKAALRAIDWDTMYKRYGQPNDLLVKLNVHHFRVADVYMKPVYNVGERSGISIPKVTLTIGWLLVRLFFWRLKEKYVLRDFHPLIFFYLLGFFLVSCCCPLTANLLWRWYCDGYAPPMTTLALLFCASAGMQSLFFAMWFDKDSADRAAAVERSSSLSSQNPSGDDVHIGDGQARLVVHIAWDQAERAGSEFEDRVRPMLPKILEATARHISENSSRAA